MKDTISAKQWRNLMEIDFFLKWWNSLTVDKRQKMATALDRGIDDGILAHVLEQAQ